MVDSDIKRQAAIVEMDGKQWIHAQMWIPYAPVKYNQEAYAAFGNFMKIEGPAEDTLEHMKAFIRRAKHG